MSTDYDPPSMGYHVVDPGDVDPFESESRTFRPIGRALDLERLGINHVTVAPGGQVPLHYHAHETQEEAFFVLDGTLRVETPDEEFVVEEGECFVVEPGNPHRAYNPATADEAVEVLAVGAPPVDDVRTYDA